MTKIYTEKQIKEDLANRCKGHGNARRIAFLFGVSPATISYILSGKLGISKFTANILGYEVVYRRKK